MNKSAYDKLFDALSELDRNNQRIKYGKIKAERDALAAQVEQLRDGLECLSHAAFSIQEGFGSNTKYREAEDKADKVLSAIPDQCLAEVKAQAGRDGFIAGFKFGRFGLDYNKKANEYANKIRQQANGGE